MQNMSFHWQRWENVGAQEIHQDHKSSGLHGRYMFCLKSVQAYLEFNFSIFDWKIVALVKVPSNYDSDPYCFQSANLEEEFYV